jgi:hypothetical protein
MKYANYSISELKEELAALEHDLVSTKEFLKYFPDDNEAKRDRAFYIVEIAVIKALLDALEQPVIRRN